MERAFSVPPRQRTCSLLERILEETMAGAELERALEENREPHLFCDFSAPGGACRFDWDRLVEKARWRSDPTVLLTNRVSDLDQLAACLRRLLVNDGEAGLMESDSLEQLSDLFLGGLAVYRRHSEQELRRRLLNLGVPPEVAGHPEILDLFAAKTAPGALQAANRIFSDPRRYGLLLKAWLPRVVPPDWADQVAAVSAAAGVDAGWPVAPPLRTFFERSSSFDFSKAVLKAAKHSGGEAREDFEDLRKVFCPSMHYRVRGRGMEGQLSLMERTYRRLIAEGPFLSENLPPEENRRIFEGLYGPPPTEGLPPLFSRLLRLPSRRPCAPKKPDPAPLAAAEAWEEVWGFWRRQGRLPSEAEVSAGALSVIEKVEGVKFRELMSALGQAGLRAPSISKTEARGLGLFREAFPESRLLEQFTLDGSRQRFDGAFTAKTRIGGEKLILVEIDGEGHFEHVPIWGGDSMQRDVLKARLVEEAAKRMDLLMVSVHHQLVRNGAAMDPSLLRKLVLLLAERPSTFWAFLRPRGIEDMRRAHRRPSKIDLDQEVEVFVIR